MLLSCGDTSRTHFSSVHLKKTRKYTPRKTTERKLANQAKAQKGGASTVQYYTIRRNALETVELLRHKQGEAFTMVENKQVLLTYYQKVVDNLSLPKAQRLSDTAILEWVAAVLVRGLSGVRQVISHYKKSKEIWWSPTDNRGRGSKKWVHFFIFILFCLH